MSSMSRLIGLVLTIAAVILLPLGSQTRDGITLTGEVGPGGGSFPQEMQSLAKPIAK